MTSVIRALYSFFSGFGVPAYPADSVPDGAELPYITVQLMDPGWEQTTGFTANVWDRSGGFERAAGIVDAIQSAIGPGACVPAEDGAVWIYKDTPFAQHMPYAGDPNYRRIYLRLKMQALTE